MKYIDFRKLVTSPIFTPQILKNTGIVYHSNQLTRWIDQGYLTKLRGGLYAFTDILPSLTPAMLAPHLVSPSYISLATALSHHGVIPEAVYTTTSVTTKGTRTYSLPASNFTYRHIPPRLFFGYERVVSGLLPYDLAQREKALLDFFYLTPQIKNNQDLAELRLNLDEINWDILKKYATIFRHARLNHLVKLLEKMYAHR